MDTKNFQNISSKTKDLHQIGIDLTTGLIVQCSAYWANLICASYRVFKLVFVHGPLDFLGLDNLDRINRAWLDTGLNVSDCQAMID